jgi:lipopolysaccharide export system protein LptA
MRGTRWLILLAIVAILFGSGYFYLVEKKSAKEHAPAKPVAISADTGSTAINYEYGQSTNGHTNYSVKAKTYRQIRDTPNYELEGLELKLMLKDQQHYDLIKSAKADFNQNEGRMFSDGAVEITLNVPIDGQIAHPLTSIKSSGITFDSKTGKAATDRAAQFTFENGDGKCVGAAYDPTTHELHLLHQAVLNLRGNGPHSKPMLVEADDIVYQEVGGRVTLGPWSRLTRAETTIDAGPAIVMLKDNLVNSIDTTLARGAEKYPTREVHYSADVLHVSYDDDGNIKTITGAGHAKMHEESKGAVTDTSSDKADLDFVPGDTDSVLQHVLASGSAVAESVPAPDKAGKRAESRILKSSSIEIFMRADGKEIDQMKTLSAGTLEFLANAPDQHHRFLTGDAMLIHYADKNLVKDFQTTHSTTLTYPAASNKSKNAVPSKTASNNLTATFDAKGQLAFVKQWDHFTYEEGERRGIAASAALDQQANTMDLETGARIWDDNGSTDADKIHMMQKTGDYVADGHVTTSHLPDQPPPDDPKKPADGKNGDPKNADPKKKRGDMLDGDEPIQGIAPHMTSANHNKLVHYEGGAVLWQGADRVEGSIIDVDRDKHTLSASGNVTTQFVDENKDEKDKDGKSKDGKTVQSTVKIVAVSDPPLQKGGDGQPAAPGTPAPIYTVVTSEKLLYTDEDRVAHYNGRVELKRPGLSVRSDDLRAYLNPKDSGEDSRLNHAIGDGKVEIVESHPGRQRIGHGEHCDYVTSEDKVILRGHLADLYDSLKKDDSHGTELTYFTSDDRLLIAGEPKNLVNSHLQRKNHKNANPGNR